MKKLLTVAINEYKVSPLRGCINDSNNMAELCRKNGYEVIALHDAAATKHNILSELKQLANELQSGDTLIFHYSGHGSQIPSYDPSEVDGFDEILCPYDLIMADGRWTDNYITDNELNEIFGMFNEGVLIECLLDCCHSGTGTRDIKPNLLSRYVQSTSQVPPLSVKTFKLNTNKVICWSGCLDSQTSADAYIDGMYQGAFTAAFLKTQGTRADRYKHIGEMMIKYGFSQTPQLLCEDTKLTQDLF